VALRLASFKLPWLKKDARKNDPYWDFFINTPPADLANTVTELIRNAPPGNVFPTKADIHTAEITSSHVKEMARYFGADLIGIVGLPSPSSQAGEGNTAANQLASASSHANGNEQFPFAVVCVVRAEYDPGTAPGIGGQVPVQNGLFITFVLSAWIRELGFRATALQDPEAEKLAAAAGLGTINADGRLVTRQYGTRVHVANIIRTDLPLAPDGSAAKPCGTTGTFGTIGTVAGGRNEEK
jgi:hypothetical protein